MLDLELDNEGMDTLLKKEFTGQGQMLTPVSKLCDWFIVNFN